MNKPKCSIPNKTRLDRVLYGPHLPSTLLLQQLLQRIPDPTMCLEVTEQSLDQHPSLAASHFLATYLTTHFYGELTAVRHREIQALYMGSKVRKERGWWEGMSGGETTGPASTSELTLSVALPGTCHSCPVLYKTFILATHSWVPWELSLSSCLASKVNSAWSS